MCGNCGTGSVTALQPLLQMESLAVTMDAVGKDFSETILKVRQVTGEGYY